jgi:phage baseplate assembly protein W
MGGSSLGNKVNYFQGISFPFRFNGHGRVEKSKLTPDDFSRIQESIAQIIFTMQLERVMNIEFGMSRKPVFINMEDETDLAILKFEIQKAIEKNEPRVEINDITIYPDPEKEGTLIVVLDIHIIKYLKDVTLQVQMDTSNFGGVTYAE